MESIDLTTQIDPREPGERQGALSREDIPKTHQRTEPLEKSAKRARFDKDGKPMVSKGILIRKDLDKKYAIKATLMNKNKYELVNDALEYYYENFLNKSQAQKLTEAGQEGLGI
jgi:hypothetical protein